MDTIDLYFSGSIGQHIERAKRLLDRIPPKLPSEFYPLQQTCQNELERILTEFRSFSKNPPQELLRRFRRTVMDLSLIETIALPPLERFNEHDDVFLTRLVVQIKNESNYPLLPPVVSSLSQEYFQIWPPYNLLFVPLSEGDSLLHLPDLYHELGHPLLQLDKSLPRVAPFQKAWFEALEMVTVYLRDEKTKEGRRRGPAQYQYYLQLWEKAWCKGWLIEFFCDLFAIYTIGPAFAWAHLHLWAKQGHNAFQVPPRASSSHPADDARMQVMLAGLHMVGFHQEADIINKHWQRMVGISGFAPEPEYRRCFPSNLVEGLAEKSLKGLQATGSRVITTGTCDPVFSLINEAWNQFWKDPLKYSDWERSAVIKLRNLCNLTI